MNLLFLLTPIINPYFIRLPKIAPTINSKKIVLYKLSGPKKKDNGLYTKFFKQKDLNYLLK